MKNILIFTVMLFYNVSIKAQNVGVGTTTPAHKLDLAGGRMRIQHSAAGTAGIWFDAPSLQQSSFFGTMNDSHAGIFGGGGSNWNFVMNTINGNTGIGTTTPTARLDVNGTLRIRQNGATAGSTLHAADAQGNAEWIVPVAFKVLGYSAGTNILFPNSTWQEINFGNNVDYNYSSSYASGVSEFVAPIKGLYNFKSQLTSVNPSSYFEQRLQRSRVGVVSTLSNTIVAPGLGEAILKHSSLLDTDVMLEAGDHVWIEAYGIAEDGPQMKITYSATETWFSGRLLIPF